ncbi:hypothetical protein [Desulfonema magnum]|uniref:Uncharacterized protein n=1 Tax=Desulfonema magnum TaxID=45655 RepID=A0A975BQ68_9BACT|nr:hypothetical protein [Desulfonema magnum]QTA89662.1 Uncharacterized protein dnm_057190 [Desulfonema magnum]
MYEGKNVKIKYDLLDSSKEIPHFRRVQIRGEENCSLWLDKGLNIFRFEDFDKPLFHTLETYIVAEYDLQLLRSCVRKTAALCFRTPDNLFLKAYK